MKHLNIVVFVLLLIVPILLNGQLTPQVFFNANKVLKPEVDIVLIPSIQFSYSMRQIEFMENNTVYKPRKAEIRPELYVGAFALSDGFLIGVHWGFLQNSLMLSGGMLIPISIGKKKKKYHH